MYKKTVLCLANSRKPPSGRCVAGKDVAGKKGEWIRPVSTRDSREVSEEERRYEDGTRAQLLDIVTISFDRHHPIAHQVENHVLATDHPWVKAGRATWPQVQAACDSYDADFWIDAESTRYGSGDKLSEVLASARRSSLKLILVPRLTIQVQVEDGYQGAPGRRRVRGRFDYHGTHYCLSVTDPEIEERYLRIGIGNYVVDNPALCISLAEVWNGYAFRLIAAVITADRF